LPLRHRQPRKRPGAKNPRIPRARKRKRFSPQRGVASELLVPFFIAALFSPPNQQMQKENFRLFLKHRPKSPNHNKLELLAE
jgi:hypothetical protein